MSFRLTYLLPISMVNENMKRAQKRDAVLRERFHFRRGLPTCQSPPEAPMHTAVHGTSSQDIELMTIDEIINGKQVCGGNISTTLL